MTDEKKYQEYRKNEQSDNYIPLTECKHGFLYKIHSRNLEWGVFNKENNGFIGIREKFGSKYLFTEFHYDTGAPYGTVKPLEECGEIPANICINERKLNAWGDSWAENNKTSKVEPVLRYDLKESEKPHGNRQGFVDVWAETGERLPNNQYPYLLENSELRKFLEEYEKL